MAPPNELLLFATASLAAAAASLTAFGLRREHCPGWRWWVAALWLGTLGAVALTQLPAPWGAALAAPLLLQGPMLTLMGLRRFHARQRWPGSLRSDAALLAAGLLLATAAEIFWRDGGAWAVLACGLALHLYAAAVMFAMPGGREATPVLALAVTTAVLAFAPGLSVLGADLSGAGGAAQADAVRGARVVAAALGALVLGFVALTLVFERTERQLRESRRRLRLLANLDALTQVPNRRHFDELAGRALRNDPPGSAVLLLFDIDHFKQVNDQLGHPAGDRALCLVAGSVLEHLRTHDAAGRHGGDEFVLLLRDTTTDAAMGVAARIANEVQRRVQATPLPALSLSFGLVQVRGGEDIDTALRRADQALYEAKRQGRSRAVAALGDEDRPVFSESHRLGLLPC
ncbi:MAG: GGDEF domain-containing protein [Rubrivivax sp.]|nr:GGDEF domain-containing protein [Rubrivivax sp.]